MTTYDVGLDISSSVVGVCLLDQQTGSLIKLEAIKLHKQTNIWEKALFATDKVVKITSGHSVDRVFVEANAKRFAQGRTSADTILTLAKMNGCVCLGVYKELNKPKIYDINVTSARKAIGFTNTLADKRPVKEKVFEFVTTRYPTFPWLKHKAKTGKFVGQTVFNAEMRDACDAWVIVSGGRKLLQTI